MADRLQNVGVTMDAQSGEDLLFVESYGNGGFRFLGRRVEGGVILLPSGFYPLDAKEMSQLSPGDFSEAINAEEKPELLLIGTGEKMQLLPSSLRQHLEEFGFGYDLMDTGAAARTHNVLLMEGRRVCSLLLPVE